MTEVLRLLAAATAATTCGVGALALAAPAPARTGRRPLPVLRDVAYRQRFAPSCRFECKTCSRSTTLVRQLLSEILNE